MSQLLGGLAIIGSGIAVGLHFDFVAGCAYTVIGLQVVQAQSRS